LHTFPIFALVGFRDKPVRPLAVADLTRVLVATLVEGRLSRQTVAIMGPEKMPLGEAVRRVGRAVGKYPFYFRMPVAFHYALGLVLEKVMKIPLVSLAQVRILSEGIVDALPTGSDTLPVDLAPTTPFSDEEIRRGLPEAKRFGLGDLQCQM
jgi:hypothetical protein